MCFLRVGAAIGAAAVSGTLAEAAAAVAGAAAGSTSVKQEGTDVQDDMVAGSASSTRAWALGLIGLGAAISGLLLLWMLVSVLGGQLRAGGFVLGLVLIAVLGLPLLGGGYYLLRRSASEAVENRRFR